MKIFLTKIKTSKSGFSIIELMVVVAIIGVLSGIAIPNFIGTRNDRMLKSAARGLLSDIQGTRMKAISNNENWSIILLANSYQIQDAAGAVRKTVTFTDKLSGVVYGSGSATPLGAMNTPITFNSRGTCNTSYIHLTNAKGTVYGIGTLASGIVIFRQWMGTGWTN